MTFLRKCLHRRNSRKISRLGKDVLLVIVLVSSIFVIWNLDITDSIWFDVTFSKPYVSDASTLELLRQDVTLCLTKLTLGMPEKSYFTKDNMSIFEWFSSTDEAEVPSALIVLSSFNNLLSLVNVRSAIIEPSILHCMLQIHYQELLLKRNFNISNISRSKSIVTYGILGHDVTKLQQEESIANFSDAGFVPYFVKVPLADWMQSKATLDNFDYETFISHIFYKHKFCTFHLVVFHERGGYLWHAALESENRQEIPPKKELLFVDHDGAFEKFIFVSLENKILPVADFYIPSNSHYFLFEMLSSRFLECNSSTAREISYEEHPKSHPSMSVERFNRRTLIAIHQLKAIFQPLLMNLWIWGGTMLGWYRECNIIPYTSDVDFGAWASEVEDLGLIINLLLNDKHVVIKERLGMLEEALEFNIDCHGLRTDIFFLYPIKNGSWYSGHLTKYGFYFRYYFHHFTLCSAELLGEKIQVPCETEKAITDEYGPDWIKPVSSWHFESSVKNRGPNIYWDSEKLKDSYRSYY